MAAANAPWSRPRSAISEQAYLVIPTDRACRFRDGVDAGAGVERARDVEPVVLGEGLEDPGVLRKVLLREARWQDVEKLGVTSACLFESAMKAQEGLPRARAFAHGWTKRTADGYGGHFTDVRLDGLGKEASRIQGDFPSGQWVTYGWRRANLLLRATSSASFGPAPRTFAQLRAPGSMRSIDDEARARH